MEKQSQITERFGGQKPTWIIQGDVYVNFWDLAAETWAVVNHTPAHKLKFWEKKRLVSDTGMYGTMSHNHNNKLCYVVYSRNLKGSLSLPNE